MRTFAPQLPESPDRACAQNKCRVLAHRGACAAARRCVLLAASFAWVAAQLLWGLGIAAQSPAASVPVRAVQTTHSSTHPAAHSAAHSPAHARRKPSTEKTLAHSAPLPAPMPAPIMPAAPPVPVWPVNSKPVNATVVWDSRGLLIQASNSSLDQILKDVSLKTGAKVEGMGADERVFGSYGPGPARDVLAQLLDGSGYNILMVGDQGAGTPRRIVLSGRPNGPTPPPGNNNSALNSDNEPENDQDAEQRPFEPNPVMPPMPGAAPGMPVRTPQQMQQIIEERQRQMQPNVPQDTQN